jgi:hypothetical protein
MEGGSVMGLEFKDIEYDEDFGRELERGYESYMDALYSGLDEDGDGLPVLTVTGSPFCSCGVCITREQLAWATPRIIQGYIDGRVRLVNP